MSVTLEVEKGKRSGRLSVVRPDALLYGQQVIGKCRSEVEALVETHLDEPKDIDDYDDWVSVTDEQIWLELQF